MEDKFISVINYLEELNNDILNEEISNEDRLLIIIKYAIINDIFHQGSIIFTKDYDSYKVSSIQKYSYAWLLQGKTIRLKEIITKLNKLGINFSLETYSIKDHQKDYEFSFGIPKLNDIKKKTRMINKKS